MFYDELKSPYQYIYSWPILKRCGKFDFQWELKRLENIKMIRDFDVAIQNFVKLYNSKNELLDLVFSLYNQEDIINISFWWSYLAKKYNQLSDIDINIIIKWNYFNYDNIPQKMSEKYVEKISNKISIMVFCMKADLRCFIRLMKRGRRRRKKISNFSVMKMKNGWMIMPCLWQWKNIFICNPGYSGRMKLSD